MPEKRILIVEDEAVVAMDIQDRLESLGYHVPGVAQSGEEALTLVSRERPDLVLMDISIKGPVDGILTAQAIQRDHNVPAVFLTAYADEDTLRRARLSEAFGYLVKPFREHDLHTTIEIALAKHQAEMKLRDREQRFAATLRHVPEGIMTTDEHGRITLMNPEAERLTGWARAEALGQPAAEVFRLIMPGQAAAEAVQQALASRQTVMLDGECILSARDGAEHPVAGTASPISCNDGSAPKGVVLVFRDVTRERQAETQIRNAQKYESLGVLAGGLAHDFNNLLTPVLGFAGLAQSNLPADSPILPMLAQIEDSAKRAAELVRQMLAYAGKARIARIPLQLATLVKDMDRLLEHTVSKKATLELAIDPSLPLIEADSGQLQQVILNLASNASDALMELPGTVRLRTGLIQAKTADLQSPYLRVDLPEGPYVFLEMEDTGCGMAPGVLSKIFDPFFTTKFTGRGLGLAAVLGIVRGHRGTIRVQSAVGVGTTVRILLPVSATTASEHSSILRRPRMPKSCLFLVIDDEAPIRALASETIKSNGHWCMVAATGQEGLDRFTQSFPQLQGVFLDLTLPDMDGMEVLREMKQLAPNVPVILMSSYSEDEVTQRCGNLPLAGFLSKPFTPQEMMATWLSVIYPG